ncbi:MAG: hypothetical protein EBE86_008235 [Hormoscilla sp. GUM202]|nr:hypothetical protein [Hormoscilla sp. GUM202]
MKVASPVPNGRVERRLSARPRPIIERFQDLGVAIARAGDYPVGLFLWSAAS